LNGVTRSYYPTFIDLPSSVMLKKLSVAVSEVLDDDDVMAVLRKIKEWCQKMRQ
jgi:hypothetical protein